MKKFLRLLIVPGILLAAIGYCLYRVLTDEAPNAGGWASAASSIGALLAAYVAIFKNDLESARTAPEIEIDYLGDAYKYDNKTWHLFLSVTNSSKTALKNATVRVIDANPLSFDSVTSIRKISPIPLTWAYADAMSGPRTIYKYEFCDFIKIAFREGNPPGVELATSIRLNGKTFNVNKGVTYLIEVAIEGENYFPRKTWRFEIRWDGFFPSDKTQLGEFITIKNKTA